MAVFNIVNSWPMVSFAGTGGTFMDPNFPPNKVTPFILRITSTAFDGSTTTQLTRAVNIGKHHLVTVITDITGRQRV